MVGPAFPGQHRQPILTLFWDSWILTDGQEVRPEAVFAHRGEEARAGGVMGQSEIQMDGQRWDANIETRESLHSASLITQSATCWTLEDILKMTFLSSYYSQKGCHATLKFSKLIFKKLCICTILFVKGRGCVLTLLIFSCL